MSQACLTGNKSHIKFDFFINVQRIKLLMIPAIHLWMHYQNDIKFDFFINELKITLINRVEQSMKRLGITDEILPKKNQHMTILDKWRTFNTTIKLKQLPTRPFRVQVTLTKNHFCCYWLLKFLLPRNSILEHERRRSNTNKKILHHKWSTIKIVAYRLLHRKNT